MQKHSSNPVAKTATGIPGFDFIAHGGMPLGRTTLLSGTAGSAKTVFSCQFLAAGIDQFDEPGVFVTFEEQPSDIIENVRGFNWQIQEWIEEGKWIFVDASMQADTENHVTGAFDLGALLARIEYAVNSVSAKRVVIDSLGAIFAQLTDAKIVRQELFRIAQALKAMGVTVIMTAERADEFGGIARFGIEEFVTDNVIILRNALEAETRRRTIEILKFRGTGHDKGQYPFTIVPERGVEIIPLSTIELRQKSSDTRIKSGSAELDEMCGGGFFRDSIVLVSGATGTGKTLLTAEFMEGGVASNERCLLFAFEESREQLFRNATGWGFDLAAMEDAGQLKVVCNYPEAASLEDHIVEIKRQIAEFEPHRVAIDSLSALERMSSQRGFREFVLGMTAYIKDKEIAGLFTSTTTSLLGGQSITEGHISTITDTIILLRYVELFGEMRRGLAVLKMRGSAHVKEIREFTIDGAGMHIGGQIRNVVGILSGNPQHISIDELQRMEAFFQQVPETS